MDKLFPVIQAITGLCAAIMYGCRGDWGRMTYWLAAFVITIAVTFLIKN